MSSVAKTKKLDLDFEKEGRAITKAIRSMLAKAKEAGVAKPFVYFESEGRVYVMDSNHPSYAKDAHAAGSHQGASVGSVFIGATFDCGAW